MINVLPTVELRELLWTIAAIIGLYIWSVNAMDSARIYRMAKRFGTPGVLIWAKFSNLLTRSFIALEIVFVSIGANAMARPPSVNYDPVLSWTIGLLIIGASVLISFIGFQWKRVDTELTQDRT